MKQLILSACLLVSLPLSVMADDHAKMDHSQHGKMDHSQHMKKMAAAKNPVPVEAGQGGFAAIAEIVKMLSDNPDTDWSTVNINALREHLLDMDRLVMGAQVEEQAIDNGMRFNVTGEDEVLRAIQNMVPAHSNELTKMPEYTVTTENIEGGVAMLVSGADAATVVKIKGLGFFGLMATGSHHQPHHYGMATGSMQHSTH